tara:strand:- start:18 stop:203 length:186 start_codon:yes stop_codon:yes gene_type:complete
MQTIKVGDFVQYRSAMGQLMGYGLVTKTTESWTILTDQETGKEVYWSDDLLKKITTGDQNV